MRKNKEIQRHEEVRNGIEVSVVRIAPSFAKRTRFSQVLLAELYDPTCACEILIGSKVFISNVETFMQRRRAGEFKAYRYLGPGSSLSHLETAGDRVEFEKSWNLCLRLHTAAWVGQKLGISRDTSILKEEVKKLVGLLEGMDIRGWGTWDRLPHVVADDFLISVDEGFARMLTASSRTLPDTQRTAVEQLWRNIDNRREIVKNFISQHLPSKLATQLEANDGGYEEFVEVDARHLLSQALVEFTRHKLRGLDPDLTFAWHEEAHRLLAKLVRGVESLAQKGHNVAGILISAVRSATDSRREIALAEKQLLTIFVQLPDRDKFKISLYELNRSGQLSARDLIEEMLTAYTPSLLGFMNEEDDQ